MTPLLPRFHRRQLERERGDRHLAPIVDNAGVDKAVNESVDVVPATVARATLPGDTRRLRGIPVCAFGVSGVSPGSDPLAEAMRRL